MLAGFLSNIVQVYGPGRVVDVFKDTIIEEPARRLGLGGYVVRNALSKAEAANWHLTLQDSLEHIALSGQRKVEVKGTKL